MRFWPRFKRTRVRETALREEPKRMSEQVIAGRRYRVDVPYVLPKDLQEINRLDFQHYALRALLKGNYRAPLHIFQPGHILDVGCGTGRWCRDLASEYPQASITGIDLEAQWPTGIALPPTMRFVQANILNGLPFREASFDYTHQRLLVGAIPAKQWPLVLRELVRVTRPGGMIELLEASTFQQRGPLTEQMAQGWEQIAPRLGFDLSRIEQLGALLTQAGASVQTTQTIAAPLGAWGGRAGELFAVDLASVMQGFKGLYCTHLGMTPAFYETLVAGMPTAGQAHGGDVGDTSCPTRVCLPLGKHMAEMLGTSLALRVFGLDLLLVVLFDVVVDAFGEVQFLVDVARTRIVRRGTDGEILFGLPFQNALAFGWVIVALLHLP